MFKHKKGNAIKLEINDSGSVCVLIQSEVEDFSSLMEYFKDFVEYFKPPEKKLNDDDLYQ